VSGTGLDSSDEEEQEGAGGKPGGGRAGRAFVSPEERERKRLRRLLRNRASAQQARERKKHYMTSIEVRARDMEAAVSSLESRHALLERENWTLRALLKTATSAPASMRPPPAATATPMLEASA
jgi:transcription factor HY5